MSISTFNLTLLKIRDYIAGNFYLPKGNPTKTNLKPNPNFCPRDVLDGIISNNKIRLLPIVRGTTCCSDSLFLTYQYHSLFIYT